MGQWSLTHPLSFSPPSSSSAHSSSSPPGRKGFHFVRWWPDFAVCGNKQDEVSFQDKNDNLTFIHDPSNLAKPLPCFYLKTTSNYRPRSVNRYLNLLQIICSSLSTLSYTYFNFYQGFHFHVTLKSKLTE